jgi:hypothetical protein
MVDLVACYLADDYLCGASGDPAAAGPLYWHRRGLRSEAFGLVHLEGVPQEVADRLVRQGWHDRSYADGYEAARAAAPYVGRLLEFCRAGSRGGE